MEPERHQPADQATAQREVAGVDPEAEAQRLRQRLNRLEAEWQEIRTRYYGKLGDPAKSDPRQSDVVYISHPDELTIFLLPALIGVYLVVVVIQWLAARLTGSLEDPQEQEFMAAIVRYLRERTSLENQLTALGQSPRGARTDDGH